MADDTKYQQFAKELKTEENKLKSKYVVEKYSVDKGKTAEDLMDQYSDINAKILSLMVAGDKNRFGFTYYDKAINLLQSYENDDPENYEKSLQHIEKHAFAHAKQLFKEGKKEHKSDILSYARSLNKTAEVAGQLLNNFKREREKRK